MRGIAGIIRTDGQEVESAVFGRMVERMAFRRVNEASHHPNRGAALIGVMRPTVPEDRYAQPRYESADGNAILVADALLSNRTELAAQLGWSEGQLEQAADGALVMAAYERWGEACPERMEGHFAFAVWLRRERRLFLAVDALSFRPLYYWVNPEGIAFATTLRGLLAAPGIARKLNDSVLFGHLMRLRGEEEETLYAGVYRLPAAHTLVFGGGGSGIKTRRYWEPDLTHRVNESSREDFLTAFKVELEQAVSFAVRSEGNVGMLLSGGLDSTVVAVVAADILAKQGKRLQVIHYLPVAADARESRLREHDESAYVRMLEPHLPSADFHYLKERQIPLPVEAWDELFDIHQGPLEGVPMGKDEAQMGWLKEQGITQMTNGLGGNYLVSLEALPSGYLTQLAWQGRWPTLWNEAKGCREFYGYAGRQIFQAVITGPLGRAFRRRHLISPLRTQTLKALNPRLRRDPAIMAQLERVGAGPMKITEFRVKHRMAQIMKELIPQNVGVAGSVLSPEFSVQVCAPMLDRRLNRFCLGVPIEQQIKNGRDRLLMRDVIAGRVPEALRWRVTRGLPTPNFWGRFDARAEDYRTSLEGFRSSPFVEDTLQIDELERLLKLAVSDRNIMAGRIVSELVMTGRFLQWLERDGL
jgi:asparagine synthase (glutamine-hydrolysing)